MIATREEGTSADLFGPDQNTLRLKRWLEENAQHRNVLHEWMVQNGLEKQALTNLLYGRDRKPLRERAARHFGLN